MTNSRIEIPSEFRSFVTFCEDETEDFSASQGELVSRAISEVGDHERVRILRDFLDKILAELTESELARLWLSMSPPVAFQGENAYQHFFGLARERMTDELEG